MSYGSPIVIADTSEFRLYSYGNGAAYKLVRHDCDGEPPLFFQGDDVAQFREEFDAYCESEPSINRALAELWWTYS